jgi:hypothetical protein
MESINQNTSMENNFLQFLNKNGFANVIKPLEEGGIYTLQAFLCVQVDDLINELKIGKMAAKALLAKANAENSTQCTTSQNQNKQVAVLPPEAIIAINEAQDALKNQKHKHEMELMIAKYEAEMKFQDLKNELKMEQLKTEIEKERVLEKEKALEEEKRKNEKIPMQIPDPHLIDDSVLVTQSHYEFLQSCLPYPRTWVLIYRGSRDGFAASTFHSRCNRSGPTITIVKSKYIFGGYNPNSWTSSGNYSKAPGSFLFSLTNAWNNPPIEFAWRSNHGPCDKPGSGPTFGKGHDLCISDYCNLNHNSYTNFPYSYRDTMGRGTKTFAGSSSFRVSEIEVFKLTYR